MAELVVDNCRSSDGEVEGITDDYTGLEILSMVNVGLSSLSKLPSLPKLRKVSSPAATTPEHSTVRIGVCAVMNITCDL